MELIIVAVLAIFAGFTAGVLVGIKRSKRDFEEMEKKFREEAEARARDLLDRTRVEADAIRKRAEELFREAESRLDAIRKEAFLRAREELDEERKRIEYELREKRKELQDMEKRLLRRESYIDRKEGMLDKREESLNRRAEHLEKVEREFERKKEELARIEADLLEKDMKLSKMIEEEFRKLEIVSGMTKDEAKEELMRRLEEDVRRDFAVRFKEIEEEFEARAEKKARKILIDTMQRLASEQVAEVTVSVIDLPNNEMKGRIIGREGRNIRAFEMATGVDLIIDDTPEAVALSCFDPVRREIARISLERLVADGRIHPARIEEVVRKVEQEIWHEIKAAGEETLVELGIAGVHPELVTLLGRLKYRMSYGQNVLAHSKEVAYLSSMLAAELGLDMNVAKRAGLFHDIGKAVTHEVEGSHAIVGAQLLKKYGELPEVVNAAEAHHGEVEFKFMEAVVAQIADALSAARPGARRESLEAYIKRIEKLEGIAESFPGVLRAFAIQAGREVRIMVEHDKITDEEAALLAHQIAKRIENEVQYPGQIKVTVIRETRAVDYAK